MAKYRVLKDIHYVDNGVVKAVKGGLGKEVDLTKDQADKLRGKVVLLKTESDMFPEGVPLVDPVIATNPKPAEEQQVKEERKPVEPKRVPLVAESVKPK